MTKKSAFVIAEAGVNHNGSIDIGLQLVDAAKSAEADAVKFQTFRADELATGDVEQCAYQKKNALADSQFEMLKKLELSHEAHVEISAHCRNVGIEFMSTAFDPGSLKYLLEEVGIERVKIPSGEIVNPLLLLAAARSRKPVIMSTGMANMQDIEAALAVLAFGGVGSGDVPYAGELKEAFASPEGREWLSENVTLLHCTTAYPAPLETVNLRAMISIRDTFGLPTGFSDHTEGHDVALAAVAMGACLVEKHYTLDRDMEGPDHKASLEPHELREMVLRIRNVELALGSSTKEATRSEIEIRNLARRVLVAARDIEAGEILDENSIALKRAGEGISGMKYWSWVGRKANRRYHKDECIVSTVAPLSDKKQ